MRPVTFLALAAVTAATVVAAAVAYVSEPHPGTTQLSGEPAFPGLEGRVNEVARVEVKTPDGGFVLARDDAGRWAAPGKHGYPVEGGRVNELILRLAGLELMEPKTERPELYGRIRVQDVEAEGAKSRLVRLQDAAGETLAALIVGKSRSGKVGRADAGTYVRRPDEARSWLAAGRLEVDEELKAWLQRTVVELDPEHVRRVDIRHPDGTEVTVVREEPGAEPALAAVPEGREADARKVSRLVAALGSVRFDDVAPASEVDFEQPHPAATFATFDGLEVTAEVVRRDDEPWLRLAARAAEAAGEDASGDDPAARAEAIAARVDGWAYRVPDYLGERLTRTREDLLAAKEDETS